MADTAVPITAGTGTNIDTRTEGTNGNHRQVVTIGDPATNAGIAPVDATAGLKVNLGSDNDVTNAGTFAVQSTLQAGTATFGKLAANSGVDIGDVDVTSSALPTGASTAANQATVIGHVDGIESLLTGIDADTANISTNSDTIAGAVSGTEMQTDVVSSALPTGASTAAKQDTVIGHVDGIETLLTAIDADTSNIATDVSTLAGAVSGTEIQADIVAALPAGTNAIGKLAANSGVDIGDVDVLSLPALAAGTSTIGSVLPNQYELAGNTVHVSKYYTSTGAATDGIVWSPATGKRWYITDIFINVSAAATVTLEDDLTAGDSAVWKAEFAANSGWSHSFTTPLYSGEDAADLLVTTSAGNVYLTITGYEI